MDHYPMDGEEARRVIRDVDQWLRGQHPTFALFEELSEQAASLAGSLGRSLYGSPELSEIGERPSNDWDEVSAPHDHPVERTDLRQAQNARKWMLDAGLRVGATIGYISVERFNVDANARLRSAALTVGAASGFASRTEHVVQFRFHEGKLHHGTEACVWCGTWRHLHEIARDCRRAVEPPSFIGIPAGNEVHPPRHGQLNPGMLARLVAADISEHIEEARRRIAKLTDESANLPVDLWSQDVETSLYLGLSSKVKDNFYILTRDAKFVDKVAFRKSELIEAYYTICINYLLEVLDRMPDYTEASEQGPPGSMHSISIHGGTFYGGQFASQIANINSTITNVVNQGDAQLGEALKAIEQAVLNEPDLDDEGRSALLDNIEDLATAANTPPEKRRRGTAKAALAAITTAATAGTQLHQALESWGAVLNSVIF